MIICLTGLSCRDKIKERSYNPKAIELNNRAMDIYSINVGNPDSTKKAIQLLDAAITLDSTYYVAYGNKSTILCGLGDEVGSLEVLKKILSIDSSILELKMGMGFMLEKMGKLNEANIIYKSVLHSYDQKIKLEPNNHNLKLDRAFIILFTEGKDKGILEYKQLAIKYREIEGKKLQEDLFISFDRADYINSFCLEHDTH